jgi:hypothetical protein
VPDLPDFPKWVPEIVRERARELHAQSLALADEARQKVVAAAEEQQQADAQATAKALTRELQAIAKVVLQQPSNPPTLAQRLLALVALVRQQATGGAKAVREAQEAAARNWQLDADNIIRLAGDPDMQGVWKYLGQRRREGSVKTQRYFHPARDDERDSRGKPAQHWREDRFASRTEWKQAQAFEELFMFVLAMSRHARAATVAEVQHYRAAAKTYREAGTREIPGFVEGVDDRVRREITQRERVAKALQRAADEMEMLANALEADADKQRRPQIVAVVGDKLERLFGQRFHTQAATIASVILGEPVSKKTAVNASRKLYPKPGKKRPLKVYLATRENR